MKDWSDLEEKYQGMREKDPSAAEDFKKKMTERFQKTVQALEEESQAEKRQIQAMHQQRVISRYIINNLYHGVSIYLLKYCARLHVSLSRCDNYICSLSESTKRRNLQ